MSCCKDNLLIYLKIEDGQSIENIENSLVSILEYTKEQAVQAIEFAKKHEKCLIFEGTKDEVSNITLLLAKNKIGAEVKTKSLK